MKPMSQINGVDAVKTIAETTQVITFILEVL